jgi:hypothetical protein
VAELANALGLGPSGADAPWRFESSRPHCRGKSGRFAAMMIFRGRAVRGRLRTSAGRAGTRGASSESPNLRDGTLQSSFVEEIGGRVCELMRRAVEVVGAVCCIDRVAQWDLVRDNED